MILLNSHRTTFLDTTGILENRWTGSKLHEFALDIIIITSGSICLEAPLDGGFVLNFKILKYQTWQTVNPPVAAINHSH